jgi:DNA-binding response OmpR family regulator
MSKKILCIDDDPFYASLYREILSRRGFTVEHAFDAASGFEAVKKFRPDLVTLDVMMPEKKGMLDGYGLLESMRDIDDYKDLPVIMISALGEDSDAKRAMDLGASSYIPKQRLSPDLLVDEINNYLSS